VATSNAGSRSAVVVAKEKAAEEVEAALKQFHGALEAIGKLEAESEADANRLTVLRSELPSWKARCRSLRRWRCI